MSPNFTKFTLQRPSILGITVEQVSLPDNRLSITFPWAPVQTAIPYDHED